MGWLIPSKCAEEVGGGGEDHFINLKSQFRVQLRNPKIYDSPKINAYFL